MDMLQSANNAILNTKTSVDTFSTGLNDLADSVGSGPFIALVAGALVLAAGFAGISVTGIARVDEYFGWPIWSSIFPTWRVDEAKKQLKRKRDDVAQEVASLVQQAVHKYYQIEEQQLVQSLPHSGY
ncbi:uncharacterized protein LOC126983969 [Eriocheir sinensis]|uniref:uncharacterized protein LOC126983969 n=1 Tax=Eriocheir sinensis TaxID=95602 RepID=UPI0021C8B286|nr:uncharacterized protein LOC126983969 [Eriocheir sinensis]